MKASVLFSSDEQIAAARSGDGETITFSVSDSAAWKASERQALAAILLAKRRDESVSLKISLPLQPARRFSIAGVAVPSCFAFFLRNEMQSKFCKAASFTFFHSLGTIVF